MQNLHSFEIAELLGRYLAGASLTDSEQNTVNTWIAGNNQLWQKLNNSDYLEKRIDSYWSEDNGLLWRDIMNAISGEELKVTLVEDKPRIVKFRTTKLFRYAAAIASITLLSFLGWLYFNQSKSGVDRFSIAENRSVDSLKNTGQPAAYRGHSAALLLANGEIIQLAGIEDNVLTVKDGTLLHSNKNELIYTKGESNDPSLMHTLIIPLGNTYQLRLSDGTNIWLNAGSTLRFPTKFDGGNREVFLSGEAYFDVTHDKEHPFIVKTEKMNVTVLGTSFNVSSYPDDPEQKTTLFKGSVRVNELKGNKVQKEVLLEPGYEAVIKNNSSEIFVKKLKQAGLPEWKDNLFVFDNEGLASIMRRLGREYNVKISYAEGVDTTLHYTGRIEMGEKIYDVLELIELIGKVRFMLDKDELLVLTASRGEKE